MVMSEMGLKQRIKGKVGEREWVNFLKRYGCTARRTKQHDGRDSPDIESNVKWDGLRVLWEVTTDKACRIGTEYLRAKVEQAEAAWPPMGNERDGWISIVAWREHRRGWRVSWTHHYRPHPIIVTVDAEHWMEALGYRRKP